MLAFEAGSLAVKAAIGRKSLYDYSNRPTPAEQLAPVGNRYQQGKSGSPMCQMSQSERMPNSQPKLPICAFSPLVASKNAMSSLDVEDGLRRYFAGGGSLLWCGLVVFMAVFVGFSPVYGQEGTLDGVPAVLGDDTPDPNVTKKKKELVNDAELTALIDQLGANSFQSREAAMSQLLQIGPVALTALRSVDTSSDPELKQRIDVIAERLSNDDFEGRVAAFLALDPGATLPGWEYARTKLGDRLLMRELYVEICRKHPAVVRLIGGTVADRMAAQQTLTAEIATAALNISDLPNQPNTSDVLAILLIATDPELPPSEAADSMVVRLLRRFEIISSLNDPETKDPLRDLLGQWLVRVGKGRRLDALAISIQFEFVEGVALAKLALQDANDVETAEWAIKALAKFGKPEDADVLRPFLQDARPAGNGYILRDPAGRTMVVKLGDVAMAAVAKLHERELRDIGFPIAQMAPMVVFDIDTLGFPIGEAGDQARARVLDEVNKLLAKGSEKTP